MKNPYKQRKQIDLAFPWGITGAIFRSMDPTLSPFDSTLGYDQDDNLKLYWLRIQFTE